MRLSSIRPGIFTQDLGAIVLPFRHSSSRCVIAFAIITTTRAADLRAPAPGTDSGLKAQYALGSRTNQIASIELDEVFCSRDFLLRDSNAITGSLVNHSR